MKDNRIREELELLTSEMSNAIYSDIKSTTEYRLMLKMDLTHSTSIICAMIDDIAKANKVDATLITKAIHDTFSDIEMERVKNYDN